MIKVVFEILLNSLLTNWIEPVKSASKSTQVILVYLQIGEILDKDNLTQLLVPINCIQVHHLKRK